MATKNQRYDHEQYTVHMAESAGETGGGATTNYAKFAAFTTMQIWSAQATVTTAGTATTNILSFNYITSTSTTTLGTCSFGTSASGVTTNVVLGTQSSGGFQMAQGAWVQALTGADATGKCAVTYEYSITPLANLTA